MSECLKWHQLAAERGLVGAQHNLGVLHMVGGRKGFAEGMKWFQRAARAGHPEAVVQLEAMPLQSPGMRVSVDGLTSETGQVTS